MPGYSYTTLDETVLKENLPKLEAGEDLFTRRVFLDSIVPQHILGFIVVSTARCFQFRQIKF